MVPLEVTHTALATPEVLARMFSRSACPAGGPPSISPFKARHTCCCSSPQSTDDVLASPKRTAAVQEHFAIHG
jgi:hypothetical protein